MSAEEVPSTASVDELTSTLASATLNANTTQVPDDRHANDDELRATLEVASRFAENVVKQWWTTLAAPPKQSDESLSSAVPTKTLTDWFPDGILDNGYIGKVKLAPSDKTLPTFIMRLDVVPSDYALDMTELRQIPEAMENIGRLLQSASLFFRYAILRYELPNEDNWLDKSFMPTPYGTIRLLGTNTNTAPQIGVIVKRKASKKEKKGKKH
jgi:hypothetical protein